MIHPNQHAQAFQVRVCTLSATYQYCAIAATSSDCALAALDYFGAASVSVIPVVFGRIRRG